MKIFLRGFKISVKYVGPAVREGCLMVQLEDHDNKFNAKLLEKLRAALDSLANDVRVALEKENKEEYIEEEVERIHIQQMDYT